MSTPLKRTQTRIHRNFFNLCFWFIDFLP